MDNVYDSESDYENEETKFTKKFRPEWLNSENTIFINKLNEIVNKKLYQERAVALEKFAKDSLGIKKSPSLIQ